jgi:hypothetical protein
MEAYKMKKFKLFCSICFAALMLSSVVQAQQISGEYIESRNVDVYTGSCFAMSELKLGGDQAILAWHVSKGEWNGVKLDGLSVVGVARTAGTLGNSYEKQAPARAILIFDDKATAEQRDALKSFAQNMSGNLLQDVVRTEVAPIDIKVEFDGEHPSTGSMKAGNLAGIVTRSIHSGDHVCGNEEVYFSPLAKTSHTMPAVAVLDQFKGDGLGVSWTSRERRSAFVGHFAR